MLDPGEPTLAAAEESHGLWWQTARPAPAMIPLKGERHAEVVVIGGGYTGCSAALHLAMAGKAVVVLEAQEPGFGAAGRNVGLVNAGMWTRPDHAGAMLGAERGERLLSELGAAPALVFDLIKRHAIECEATMAGTLHCAVGRRGLTEILERAAQWRARGAPVELLDGDAVARRTGSPRYTGALLDRRAGTIQPLSYVRGLADAAIRAGAVINHRSPVRAIERAQAQWRVVTAEGTVRAPIILMCTDAYSILGCSELRDEQVIFPYFNIATAPLSDARGVSILAAGEGAWDTNRILSSFRRDRAGRVIFGSVGALRGPGAMIHRSWARSALRRLFPDLGDIRFTHGWHGMIGMTPDALPRFHQPAPGIYSISGYNGRGIAPGTTFGRDLARLAMKDCDPDQLALPLTTQGKAPFARTRTLFYEVGAQVAHLASSTLRPV